MSARQPLGSSSLERGHDTQTRAGVPSRVLQRCPAGAHSRGAASSGRKAGPPPPRPRGGPEISRPPLGDRSGFLGQGGLEWRGVPGGYPATPPPAEACPRRAWRREAGPRVGGKDRAREARPPRVLQAQETGGTLGARAPTPRRRLPARQPSPLPSPRGARTTGSVANARPGHRKCGGPASAAPTPGREPRRSGPLGSSWRVNSAGSTCVMQVNARKTQEGELEDGKPQLTYLWLPRKLLTLRREGRTGFADVTLATLTEGKTVRGPHHVSR